MWLFVFGYVKAVTENSFEEEWKAMEIGETERGKRSEVCKLPAACLCCWSFTRASPPANRCGEGQARAAPPFVIQKAPPMMRHERYAPKHTA